MPKVFVEVPEFVSYSIAGSMSSLFIRFYVMILKLRLRVSEANLVEEGPFVASWRVLDGHKLAAILDLPSTMRTCPLL